METLYENNTGNSNKIKTSVPNSTGIMVLGILSLVFNFCCCIPFLSTILSIITILMAGSAEREYRNNPGMYSESSYSNIKTGKICAVIGIVLSLIVIVLYFMGTSMEIMNQIFRELDINQHGW